jgi:hypothetical protein
VIIPYCESASSYIIELLLKPANHEETIETL